MVFIKDLEIINNPNNTDEVVMVDDEKAKVEGTGSGFIWDTFGHIVGYLFLFSTVIHHFKFSIIFLQNNNNNNQRKHIAISFM